MKTQKIDGEDPRQRLLHAAVNCFAAHGFAQTSTRQIATEAGANIAAISYYFGDKAGLYRAAFTEPMGSSKDDIVMFEGDHLTLDEALYGLYGGFIEPLKQNLFVQQCIRLHMREMVEPTGMWDEEIDQGIRPHHQALASVLCRHYGVKKRDDDITRLVISIVALGVHLYVGRDLNMKLHPKVITGDKALDVMRQRLVMYARAMIDAEGARRTGLAAKALGSKPVPKSKSKLVKQ